MRYEEKYLLKMAKCQILAIPCGMPEEKIDLESFYKKASDHKLENILFKSVCENIKGFYKTEKVLGAWQKQNLFSTVSLVRLNATVNEIIKRLEEEKVSVILLKGAVLKNLYPKKEMRTMSDTDIILKEQEFKRCERVFKEFGYTLKEDLNGNPVFTKEDNYKFEAFFKLSTIDKVWEKVDNIEGYKYIKRLNNESFLFHLVSHIGKHLRYTGAGIRNLIDIYLVMEKWDIDYKKLLKMLEEKGNTELFYAIVKIIEIYFDFKSDKISSKTDETTAKRLMEFMISYGVYGKQNNENIFIKGQKIKVLTGKDKFFNAVRMFFPKKEKLSEKYSYALKYPFLLPVAWIHRLFDKRFIEKRTLKNTVREIDESNQIANFQKEIIEMFKL